VELSTPLDVMTSHRRDNSSRQNEEEISISKEGSSSGELRGFESVNGDNREDRCESAEKETLNEVCEISKRTSIISPAAPSLFSVHILPIATATSPGSPTSATTSSMILRSFLYNEGIFLSLEGSG